jgi:hypothetical protein
VSSWLLPAYDLYLAFMFDAPHDRCLLFGVEELSRRCHRGGLACKKTTLMATISDIGLAVAVVDRSSYVDSIPDFLRNGSSGL